MDGDQRILTWAMNFSRISDRRGFEEFVNTATWLAHYSCPPFWNHSSGAGVLGGAKDIERTSPYTHPFLSLLPTLIENQINAENGAETQFISYFVSQTKSHRHWDQYILKAFFSALIDGLLKEDRDRLDIKWSYAIVLWGPMFCLAFVGFVSSAKAVLVIYSLPEADVVVAKWWRLEWSNISGIMWDSKQQICLPILHILTWNTYLKN